MLTRQGLYCFTADGMLLDDTRHCSAERLMLLLAIAQRKFRAISEVDASIDTLKADKRYNRAPPSDGLVVDVFAKILLRGVARQDSLRINPGNGRISRDHLWITESEVKAMAPPQWKVGLTYPMPLSLAIRIGRFHLVDNIRGEPPLWTIRQIRSLSVTLELVEIQGSLAEMKLKGFVHLATSRRDRAYRPTLFGEVIYDANKKTLTRFDVLAFGDASGEGRYARGCPQGEFSLAIAFTLSDTGQSLNQLPPHGARLIEEYFGDRDASNRSCA